MNPNTRWAKSLVLFAVVLGVMLSTFTFAVLHHDDGDNRVAFTLVNHNGQRTGQDDLAGRHLLVFFGFTSCADICPTQMSKLTTVMNALHKSGHRQQVTPVFVTVDPERDDPQQLAQYLAFFHEDFVGLTGSRSALNQAADSFKTFLQAAPRDRIAGYQVTHSSIVYVVDPFSRIVDYIPLDVGHEAIANKIREVL